MRNRLDLKLLLLFFVALLTFCALGVTGIYFLDKKESKNMLAAENAKISQELIARKHAFISDILLKHDEGFKATLEKARADLQLASLDYSPTSTESALKSRDSGSGKFVTGRVDLNIESQNFGQLIYSFNVRIFHPYGDIIGFICVYFFAFSVLFLVFFSAVLKNEIFEPMRNLIFAAHPDFGPSALKLLPHKSEEISQLKNLMLEYIDIVEKNNVELASLTKLRSQAEIAAQVSHDIRSPLASLDMVISNLKTVGENDRLIIRNSVNRIRDIANDLLRKEKEALQKTGSGISAIVIQDQTREDTLLYPLIDVMVTEKRIQYRNTLNGTIHFDQSDASYGLFSAVNSIELKRILSNLIDNAHEAMTGKNGEIDVSISSADQVWNIIKVKDNGKGFPEKSLAEIGKRGATFGKTGGSGLGLFHAKTTIERWGGSLEIQSEPGKGSTIEIRLPRVNTPSWFVPQIEIKNSSKIIILDDDQSIHHIWKSRFEEFENDHHNLTMEHFRGIDELRTYYGQNFHALENAIYLIDYEITGQSETGLSLIEQLGINDQSILVTSRYEEEEIRSRCEKLKIKFLPKPLSGFVPIAVDTANA